MAAADQAAEGAPLEITDEGLREGLERARARLVEHRETINQLNVFPVPDGDTGSNLQLTVEAAWQEVRRLPRGAGVGEVARAAAHGALMGARGNSGVILSQVLRGFAARSEGQARLDAAALCDALQEGSQAAYRAVKRPVEGTMLTVIRDAAEAASGALSRRLPLPRVLEAMVAEAWAEVERTQEQMELLRQAGVVDAGGFGLAVLLTALAEPITGPSGWPSELDGELALEEEAELPSEARGAAAASAPEQGFGYCTEFILLDSELEPAELRRRLGAEAEEDSALVVGDPGLVHVHVHTRAPWELLGAAAGLGRIERLKVEDMTEQHRQLRRAGRRPEGREREPKPSLPRVPLGVVLVARGEGFRQLLLGLGASAVVEGGQSANPSTEQLLAGVRQARARQALLLPNNPNAIMVAEQAVGTAPERLAVVPSRNLPQGIAALLAFDPEADLALNRRRMEQALEGVHAIEVTVAQRDSRMGPRQIREGEYLALLDGDLASSGPELEEVVLEALAALPAGSVEVVTLYRGEGVQEGVAESLERALRGRFPELEVERHDGGQPLYPFIISAE